LPASLQHPKNESSLLMRRSLQVKPSCHHPVTTLKENDTPHDSLHKSSQWNRNQIAVQKEQYHRIEQMQVPWSPTDSIIPWPFKGMMRAHQILRPAHKRFSCTNDNWKHQAIAMQI
jgi:hypothetical protein